jgi:hypothetical protein
LPIVAVAFTIVLLLRRNEDGLIHASSRSASAWTFWSTPTEQPSSSLTSNAQTAHPTDSTAASRLDFLRRQIAELFANPSESHLFCHAGIQHAGTRWLWDLLREQCEWPDGGSISKPNLICQENAARPTFRTELETSRCEHLYVDGWKDTTGDGASGECAHIVLVKDPLFWLRSMCTDPLPQHNMLITAYPNRTEVFRSSSKKEWASVIENTCPFCGDVMLRAMTLTGPIELPLVEYWNLYYSSWLARTDIRVLFVRVEDLRDDVEFRVDLVEAVCPSTGGRLPTTPELRPHSGKYSAANRVKGFDEANLKLLRESLDPHLMDIWIRDAYCACV